MITELSLFTGMGGGIYGSIILGWKTIAYVEKDEYCQKIIKQRQLDGWFDAGEIYGDIKEFNKKHAKQYAGKVDVITGGFPCQPFSVAGKRKGTSDERYLFDEIVKTIKTVQPRWLFFENVPGLLVSNAIIEIYKTLDKIGYQCSSPLVLGSADCGNIHKRDRVWVFATNTTNSRCYNRKDNRQRGQICNLGIRNDKEDKPKRPQFLVGANSDFDVQPTDSPSEQGYDTKPKPPQHPEQQKSQLGNSGKQSIDTNNWSERVQGVGQKEIQRQFRLSRREDIRSFEDLLSRPDIPEPLFWGVDDELPNWKQQLKAIGNGQDPITMATAWKILAEGALCA